MRDMISVASGFQYSVNIGYDLGSDDKLKNFIPTKSALNLLEDMELFHDYIRGGIEVMYEQFTDGCQTQDDYLSKTYEVMSTFKKEIEGISYAEELSKFIR